jgi:hypothetical protein
VMSAQGVWEFSRSFLGDRDGCVAVIKIFMDETGIHDDAHTVAVAAYISRPKHWRSWTKSWNAAKRPIKVFHATDCASFHGEFEGWNKEQRDQFVAKLLPVIPAHELAGIVIGIKRPDLGPKGVPRIDRNVRHPLHRVFPVGDLDHHGNRDRPRERRANGIHS